VTLLSSIIGAAAVIWAAVISSNAKHDLEVKNAEIRKLQEQLSGASQASLEPGRAERGHSPLTTTLAAEDADPPTAG